MKWVRVSKWKLEKNHQFYVDDLKLYTKNDDDSGLLSSLKRFSDDIEK